MRDAGAPFFDSDGETLEYYVVDVFTGTPFAGNPLAVVLGADDLSDRQLQQLAVEFNLQETAFPMAPTGTGSYRLRIFTPVQELPFAGHPSVDSAWLLHRLGRLPAGPAVQECGAGLLPIEITESSGAVSVTLHGGRPEISDPVDPVPLLRACGLRADATTAPTAVAGVGLPFVYLPVSEDDVRAAALPIEPLTSLARTLSADGACLFSFTSAADGSLLVHSRVIAGGVGEDPATGSAALGLGVWLAANGHTPVDGAQRYTVHQGAELGRPSVLECTVLTILGQPSGTLVRGSAVPIAQGRITRPE